MALVDQMRTSRWVSTLAACLLCTVPCSLQNLLNWQLSMALPPPAMFPPPPITPLACKWQPGPLCLQVIGCTGPLASRCINIVFVHCCGIIWGVNTGSREVRMASFRRGRTFRGYLLVVWYPSWINWAKEKKIMSYLGYRDASWNTPVTKSASHGID